MGNAAIKAESEFGDKISRRNCGDCDVDSSPTFCAAKSSALPDTSVSFEDAVSITTDSTPSITEYESANENDAKRFSSGSDISCDFPMDTKSSTTFSHSSSVSNDCATFSPNRADYQQLLSQAVTVDINHSITSPDHRFVGSANSIVQPQRVNIEELDRENQLFHRSRDHRTRSKVKRHEESRRRAPAGKKSGKNSRQTAEQARKKHQPKKPTQKPPIAHNDFFIFSYDHVFKEAFADDIQSSTRENPLQKISVALSDTITKVSQLLDDAERRAPSLTLPHSMWTRLLNVRASYVPFFEFHVYNVHLFRGGGEPLSKLEAVEVRRFFAKPTYLDLLRKFEFCLKVVAHTLVYVVDASKSDSLLDGGMLVTTSYCCSPNTSADSSHEMASANEKKFDADLGSSEVALNDCLSPNTILESPNLVVQSPKLVTNVNNEAVPSTKVAEECIRNHLPQPSVVTPLESAAEIENSAPSPEESSSAFNDVTSSHNEPISTPDFNSNATSLELVDDRCSSLTAEETEEFDSCVESVDGGPASDGWSDICSLPGENSFAFPSLRSEILQCAFQLDSINSENMNCNENVSEAGPATAADLDNINNIPFLNDSSELDYISKIGGTGLVAENLRKQSLYVKFDPLVAGEADVTFNGDATVNLEDALDSSKHELSNDTLLQPRSEEKRRTSDVNESLNHENGSVGKLISVTPNRSPRKTKEIPAAIDVEESKNVITPRTSPRFPETDPEDVAKLQSLLLKQMKKEEAFKEEIDSLKRDYEQVLQKLQNAEKETARYKAELESTQENEKKLKNDLKERIKSKQQLSVVMGEYEKTISQMLTQRDEDKKEFEATVKKVEAERDSTVQHLNNLENAFNDIHQKYERGKIVNEALKKNDELLQKSISEYETTVKTVENKYELLKSHATSQLEKANQELELITQSYEKEQAKLKAMLRKSEIQINSLQNALDRKTKENQELTAICDELIVKLSTHSNA